MSRGASGSAPWLAGSQSPSAGSCAACCFPGKAQPQAGERGQPPACPAIAAEREGGTAGLRPPLWVTTHRNESSLNNSYLFLFDLIVDFFGSKMRKSDLFIFILKKWMFETHGRL